MATIKAPRGRMTIGLATSYNVGDKVILTVNPDAPDGPRVGDTGIIRRIFVSDPNDGDSTFLVFDVRWANYGRIWPVGEDEMVAISKAEAWFHDVTRREAVA